MRILDVVLGLGAIGVAVVAAKLIADASKKPVVVTVALPPADSTVPAPVTITPVNTGKSAKPTPAPFNLVQDCTGDMSTSQACWCWGEGYGKPECKDFDYAVLFDGQSVQS